MKIAKAALVTVGLFSMVLALFGLWYNLQSLRVGLSGGFSELTEQFGLPYFYLAFYAMSGVCIVCYVTLLYCGVQLLRCRTGVFGLFVGVLVFEVAYFLSALVTSAAVPGIGRNVGAAWGVANGGLVAQGLVLFPAWAPLLARWGKRRLSRLHTNESVGC